MIGISLLLSFKPPRFTVQGEKTMNIEQHEDTAIIREPDNLSRYNIFKRKVKGKLLQILGESKATVIKRLVS